MRFFNLQLSFLWVSLVLVTANNLDSELDADIIQSRAIKQHTLLRIEGLSDTIFEASIHSGPGNVTTLSGGTHPCTGTNNNANPTPGNTPTDALLAASKKANFPFDGTFDAQFDDFFITSIGSSVETSTEFWGLLVNYQFTPVGGCQFETQPNDNVLWAFNAFNMQHFLKLEPQSSTVKRGRSLQVTVTDGATGVPVAGASVDGVETDADGHATLTFPKAGKFEFKATKSGSLRSNAISIKV